MRWIIKSFFHSAKIGLDPLEKEEKKKSSNRLDREFLRIIAAYFPPLKTNPGFHFPVEIIPKDALLKFYFAMRNFFMRTLCITHRLS